MKYLIPLLLLAACSYEHDHPVGDHTHDHDHAGHQHFGLFSLGLPYAYIMHVDPPPIFWGIPPIGVLTKRTGEGEYQREPIIFQFSRRPENFRVEDLDLPWLNITPIGGAGLEENRIIRASVYTDCQDPDHTGYIAFRLSWDTGSADFVYKCPGAD